MFQFKAATMTQHKEINNLAKAILAARTAFPLHCQQCADIGFKSDDIKNVEVYRFGKRIYFKVELKNGLREESDCVDMATEEIKAIYTFTSISKENKICL